MSISILEVILDLRDQAEVVAAQDPKVAGHLEADVDALLSGLSMVTVADAAAELGVTEPTVRSWIRQGYLVGHGADRGMLIQAGSLLEVLPILRDWRRSRAGGYPATALRAWFGAVAEHRTSYLADSARHRERAMAAKGGLKIPETRLAADAPQRRRATAFAQRGTPRGNSRTRDLSYARG